MCKYYGLRWTFNMFTICSIILNTCVYTHEWIYILYSNLGPDINLHNTFIRVFNTSRYYTIRTMYDQYQQVLYLVRLVPVPEVCTWYRGRLPYTCSSREGKPTSGTWKNCFWANSEKLWAKWKRKGKKRKIRQKKRKSEFRAKGFFLVGGARVFRWYSSSSCIKYSWVLFSTGTRSYLQAGYPYDRLRGLLVFWYFFTKSRYPNDRIIIIGQCMAIYIYMYTYCRKIS